MPDVRWSSEFDRERFSEAGLITFDEFWNLEESGARAEYKPVKQHLDPRTGEKIRHVTIVRVNRIKYYLKRASGGAYSYLETELKALKVLPDFGLDTARLLAYGFDSRSGRAFLLFKGLSGYHSLHSLINMEAPPEAIAGFQVHKKAILMKIVMAMQKLHRAEYFYPDWKAKHIFVRRGTSEVVLVDLGRFRHLSQCPWYFKYRIARSYLKNREWRRLRKALGAKIYTKKFLRRLLREQN